MSRNEEKSNLMQRRNLRSFTSCWCNTAAFLEDSGTKPQSEELRKVELKPENRINLEEESYLERNTETWKRSRNGGSIIYLDTAGGSNEYVLSKELTKVWAEFVKPLRVRELSKKDENTTNYIDMLLQEGLLRKIE